MKVITQSDGDKEKGILYYIVINVKKTGRFMHLEEQSLAGGGGGNFGPKW